MIKPILLAFTLAALAACASTPPTYSAATSPTGRGYSETQIENNRYFVTYRAGGPADAQLLEDYALLRAADVAVAHGADWFWVDRRTTDTTDARRSGPSVGVGIGGGSWGRHGGTSVGVGVNFPIGNQSSAEQATAATLEIRFGNGAKPDEANAYDARSTAANLRSRLNAG